MRNAPVALLSLALAGPCLAQQANSPGGEDGIVDVYVVPMGAKLSPTEIDKSAIMAEFAEQDCCGQVMTDIHPSIYEKVVKDIKAKKPDLVVYELYSADIPQRKHVGGVQRDELGMFRDDELRRMVKMLREDLGYGDDRSVMWVKDSSGFGSLLAMSWPQLYMASDARLNGLFRIMERAAVQDPQVRAKFREAVVAIANGFLQSGGFDLNLGVAMMRPEKMLSAKWEGRTIKWLPDTSGTWVIDDNDKDVANFTATTAEELGLCRGVADSLDELMYLMGYPQWRQVDGDGDEMVIDYIKDWRKAYVRSQALWSDYQQHTGWASGEDTVKYLGMAKQDLEKILAYMNKYEAVETRWAMDGLQKIQLETMIGRLNEQLRGLRKGQRGSGGGGGGGGEGGGRLGGG